MLMGGNVVLKPDVIPHIFAVIKVNNKNHQTSLGAFTWATLFEMNYNRHSGCLVALNFTYNVITYLNMLLHSINFVFKLFLTHGFCIHV